MCPHGLGPRLCIELSAPEIRKAVLRAENRKYRAQEPAAGGSRGGAKGESKPTTRYARSPPWIDFTYSVSIPRSRQLGRLGLKASANGDLCTEGKNSSRLFSFLSEQTQNPEQAMQGWLRGSRCSAPSLARRKPPATASDQRSQSALTSRDFLPRVRAGVWGGGGRPRFI